jgi:predicted nuclease of restriction endonuclease-like (RecB) superfamily
LKDPYIFDFLTLGKPFRERELELGLLAEVQKLLLELGQGFAFVGRQFPLEVGTDNFYLTRLRLRPTRSTMVASAGWGEHGLA